MQGETISRTLFENGRLLLGEFWCLPQSERWQSLNSVSAEPHVIFPRTAVTIRQLGRDPAICDRNQIVFYNPGQRFFRSLRTRSGDHCYFVELSRELMRRLADGATNFPFASGPSESSVFLLQRLATRHVKETDADAALVEEALTTACERAIEDAWRAHLRVADQREGTRAANREIVDQTRQLLVARYRERLTMAEVASALGVSRFQLSRVFRSYTGFSLLEYRNHLRLRAAFDRLTDPDLRLASLAEELGFSNHSHLTESFRVAFGFLPSELRGPIGRETLGAALAWSSTTTNVRVSAEGEARSPL